MSAQAPAQIQIDDVAACSLWLAGCAVRAGATPTGELIASGVDGK
jgi:hypothetical protein